MPAYDVFIVEDNPADALLIMNFFKKRTNDVRFNVLTDGEMAIEHFKNLSNVSKEFLPELITLDLNLPRKNGLEVLKFIKNDEILKATPVVIFSTSSALEDIKGAYTGFANCYIIKPFSLDEFETAVQRIYEYWFETTALPNDKRR